MFTRGCLHVGGVGFTIEKQDTLEQQEENMVSSNGNERMADYQISLVRPEEYRAVETLVRDAF